MATIVLRGRHDNGQYIQPTNCLPLVYCRRHRDGWQKKPRIQRYRDPATWILRGFGVSTRTVSQV